MTLILHYPFDTSSTDDVAAGNNGTANGVTTGVAGINDTNAYSFDGSNDYVRVDGNPFPQFISYTFTGWLNSNNASYSSFQTLHYPNSSNDVHPGINTDGTIRYWQRSGGSSTSFDGPTLNSNQWYHYAQVWDGSTLYGYLDGELVGSASISGMDSRNDNDDIGYDSSGGSWPFYGSLDDFRIYDHAMSATEVKSLYQSYFSADYATSWRSMSVIPAELQTTATIPTNTSVDAYVQYDSDGDGFPDIEERVSLSDGSNTYTLSNFDSTGDYRVYLDYSTTDVTTTASIDSITVQEQQDIEISGTAMLQGSPVQGAKIYVIDATNGDIEATDTTDSNGNYSVLVEQDIVVDVVAQYDDGTDTYNTEAHTYLNT